VFVSPAAGAGAEGEALQMKLFIIAQFAVSFAIIGIAAWRARRAGDPHAKQIDMLLKGAAVWFTLILLAMWFKIF
jgi:hypothetical protein